MEKKRLLTIRKLKAQAAVEFLSTYGWVLVMIVVAIAALSYLGVLTPITPERCTFEIGVSCNDFVIQENSVSLLLKNVKGEAIKITSIGIEGCAGTDSGRLKMREQSEFVISGCSNIDRRFDGIIQMTYSGRGGLEHTVFGRLVGMVLRGGKAEERRDGILTELKGPIIDVPKGSQRYFIRSNPKSPQLTEAIIDPLDVHVGDIQMMTVHVRDNDDTITSVTAAIETDTGIKTEHLSLIQELSKGRTVWQGSWKVRDTHSRTYRTRFTATNSKGETASSRLTWSDPCAPPSGGDWKLDNDCGISGVQGVDEGDFVVQSFTLSVNEGATFVWNPGESINVTNGSIAIVNGAKLTQSYMWMGDQDSDGTPTNNTMFYGLDAPEGDSDKYRRRKHMGNNYWNDDFKDCLDFGTGAANIFQDLSGVGNDSDQDGRVGSSPEAECVGTPETVDGNEYYKGITGDYNWMKDAAIMATNLKDLRGGQGWTSGTSFVQDCMDYGVGAAHVFATISGIGADTDGDGYMSGGANSNCAGEPKTIGGRQYYKDTSGDWDWLDNDDKHAGNDIHDNDAKFFQNLNCFTDEDGDGRGGTIITTTVEINASADTWMGSANPNAPYGSDTKLYTGDISGSQSANTRSLVKFNLSGIPVNATITEVNLSLYEYNAAGAASRDVQVHPVLKAWTEAQATWNERQSGTAWAAGGAIAYCTKNGQSCSSAGECCSNQCYVDGDADGYSGATDPGTSNLAGHWTMDAIVSAGTDPGTGNLAGHWTMDDVIGGAIASFSKLTGVTASGNSITNHGSSGGGWDSGFVVDKSFSNGDYITWTDSGYSGTGEYLVGFGKDAHIPGIWPSSVGGDLCYLMVAESGNYWLGKWGGASVVDWKSIFWNAGARLKLTLNNGLMEFYVDGVLKKSGQIDCNPERMIGQFNGFPSKVISDIRTSPPSVVSDSANNNDGTVSGILSREAECSTAGGYFSPGGDNVCWINTASAGTSCVGVCAGKGLTDALVTDWATVISGNNAYRNGLLGWACPANTIQSNSGDCQTGYMPGCWSSYSQIGAGASCEANWAVEKGGWAAMQRICPCGGDGPTSVDGKIGKALSFDGVGDYVSVANDASLNPAAAVTVSAWVKPDTLSGTRQIVDFQNNANAGYMLRFEGGKVNFPINGGLGQITSSATISAGSWTHIAGTYDPSTSTMNIYINGVLDKTGSYSSAISSYGASLQIGMRGGVESGSWILTQGNLQSGTGAGPIAYGGSGGTDSYGDERATWSELLTLGKSYRVSLQTNGGTHFRGPFFANPSMTGTRGDWASGPYAGFIMSWYFDGWTVLCPDGSQTALNNLKPQADPYPLLSMAVNEVGTVTFEKDGVVKHTCSTPITAATFDVHTEIGPRNRGIGGLLLEGGGTHHFDGLIDDVRVYNKALSLNEISYLANQGTVETVSDSSANSNTGTVAGATLDANGKLGKALSFDGVDDSIMVPDSPSLGLTGDISIGVWVKPSATQKQYADILSKHYHGAYTIEQHTTNTNQFAFNWDTTGSGGWAGCDTVTTALTVNVWQHFAISKSGATVTHYLNGVESATCTGSSATISTNSLDLKIGGMGSGAGREFNGLIDDVRIYNDALSAGEIQFLWGGGSKTCGASASLGADVNDGDQNVYQYLSCYVDADGDGYGGAGAQQIASGASCPSGYSATSLGVDPNDENNAVYRYLTCYNDADNDGYAGGSGTNPGTGNLAGYWKMEGTGSCPGYQSTYGDGTCWVKENVDTDGVNSCVGVCAAADLSDSPVSAWGSTLGGNGAYATSLRNAFCLDGASTRLTSYTGPDAWLMPYCFYQPGNNFLDSAAASQYAASWDVSVPSGKGTQTSTDRLCPCSTQYVYKTNKIVGQRPGTVSDSSANSNSGTVNSLCTAWDTTCGAKDETQVFFKSGDCTGAAYTRIYWSEISTCATYFKAAPGDRRSVKETATTYGAYESTGICTLGWVNPGPMSYLYQGTCHEWLNVPASSYGETYKFCEVTRIQDCYK